MWHRRVFESVAEFPNAVFGVPQPLTLEATSRGNVYGSEEGGGCWHSGTRSRVTADLRDEDFKVGNGVEGYKVGVLKD